MAKPIPRKRLFPHINVREEPIINDSKVKFAWDNEMLTDEELAACLKGTAHIVLNRFYRRTGKDWSMTHTIYKGRRLDILKRQMLGLD